MPERGHPSLPRRRFLRGVGAGALALPFLEIFAPARAGARPSISRYAFLFGGMSIGAYGNDRIAPADEGPWVGPMTRALQPLADHGVADVVSLVSGLSMPVGMMPPAGGRPPNFHATAHPVLATGQRFSGTIDGTLHAPSSDLVAAGTIAGTTPFPVLTYRAQPAYYRLESNGAINSTISARLGTQGTLEQVPPVTSPRVAFESLFGGALPPGAVDALAAKRAWAMRKSVVDRVADDAKALVVRLGTEDKIRMQRHFDELRTLEHQIDALEPTDAPACPMPPHPGDDPPIGDAIDPGIDPTAEGYDGFYMNANGYSDEELRASIMVDLIHMAFACDLSRVASFMLTYATCSMNMFPLLGIASDLHGITHGSIGDDEAVVQDALADAAGWHVRHFARLIQKLRDTESPVGTSLLDDTALVLAFEGGWGFDPQLGAPLSPHSTENMVVLVGGRAGGLHATAGGHLRAPGVHPTAVLNTALAAVGVEQTLGEVTATVDALLG